VIDGRKIGVVIPCFRVRSRILGVLEKMGPEVDAIYVVDDGCPDESGQHVLDNCRDPRVRVIRHEQNQGVGGATMTGYLAAVQGGMDVAVKIDGDGQMDPGLICAFVEPILDGRADYTKGNRFYDPEDLKGMPAARLLGNAVLSFMSKASSGYWNIFDPTNGYTAIRASVIEYLPLDKISRRYFVETDLLFRLNLLRCRVVDIPMAAVYEGEESNLRIMKVILPFLAGHLRNFGKRISYNYFLRDFSVASLEMVVGLIATVFGAIFGGYHWILSNETDVPATCGTVMISGLTLIIGIVLLLSWINFDVNSVPREAFRPFARKGAKGTH
jgi:glycosyltransferase involved in cell wall biosynthesis